MNNLFRDFQLALRLMRKSPGTTAVIVLALALGIGVNTSSFITVSALVLHPLPFPRIGRVMSVWETVPRSQSTRDAVAPANFFDWKQQSRSFEHLAAFQPWDANLTGLGTPERVQAFQVSPEYFAVLGMKPLLGRTFRSDEAEPGHAFTVVVSHGFWQRHLASAPDVLGRRIALNGQNYTIAGVMPENFNFPLETDIWAPLAMTPAQKDDRATHNLAVLGRLKPEAPVAQARAELQTLSRRLQEQHPDTNEGRAALIEPILDRINNVTGRFTLMLFGTAGFVLLLACANVANLQLARIMSRQKEMAVRTAMGASRLRIVRQLVVENVAIALMGGALGLVLAAWNLSYMNAHIPAQVHKWVAGFDQMRIDTPVILFTLTASVMAGILCALPSFLQITRRRTVVDVNEALKESSRSSSAGPRRSRMRNTLATAEVALALVLLVGAGLMVRTFQRLLTVNCGYNPNNLLTLQIALPDSTYRSSVQIAGFYDRLFHNLQSTPDVQAAGVAASIGGADAVYIQGRADPRPDEVRPDVRSVAGQYFAALGLPIVAGRPITDQDGRDTQPVVVISEAVARHYWPNGDALRQHIRLQKDASRWLTVVGVCGDVKDWFFGKPQPAAYLSFPQNPAPAVEVFVRTGGDPNTIVGAVRVAVRDVDSNQPVFDVKSMQQFINEQTSGVRASAVNMSTYAVIALLLAVTGIYASISYSVVQRTHEIGVRMALGAARSDVLKMTLMQGVGIAAVGLGIGVPVAFTLMRVMSSVLYNVVVVEPLIFAMLTAILAASAVLAGYIPARRAASIDPLTALRDE
ncbi:MAG: ABC transporter permease [Bryobacteraceae bacterium]